MHHDHVEKCTNDVEIIALTRLLGNLVDKKPDIDMTEEILKS